ncbi:hypothetical protein Q3G72_032362 [Acer saccharum]|nr:hypothetical protein Q3G72_032362 [Acer saccharum]
MFNNIWLKKLAMCNDVLLAVILLFIASLTVVVEAYVSYDSRAITINGRRRILISGSIQYPGSTPEAHVFKSNSGACAAFLANYNQKTINAKVAFGNQHYNLPPWSISILPDCKNTVYNTARAGTQSSQMKISPVPLHGGFSWQAYNEADSSFTMSGLLEQINTTKMLQTTCGTRQLSRAITLHSSCLLMFAFSFRQNVGPHFETWNAGILGPVTLHGLNEGRRDLSWQKWSYKVCLQPSNFVFSHGAKI